MDIVIYNQFQDMNKHLLKLENKLNSKSTPSQIDDIADKFIYNQIDYMLGQLKYDPNNDKIRLGLQNASQHFQDKYGIDFGFDDMPLDSHSWRNRAWIQYESVMGKEAQGLTAKVLFKYIKFIDTYIVKLIKDNKPSKD